jgi:hypothetical protein
VNGASGKPFCKWKDAETRWKAKEADLDDAANAGKSSV